MYHTCDPKPYQTVGDDPYSVAEWIHFTPFGDNITHHKTESVHFPGLMNSATKLK